MESGDHRRADARPRAIFPEPHIWEKLKMLVAGDLAKPIDIFDLVLHAAPWLLLLLKVLRESVLK